jgi:pantoate--beta-alanine ligase
MYPPDDQTRVIPGPLAATMCGLSRPGHFAGVCTVVAKLFNIVQPGAAYFGQKDAQQAVVIQRMVQDLHMPLRIVVCPLVREADGLAMSSRNARLTPEQRTEALCLHGALCVGRDRLLAGEQSAGRLIAAMRAVVMEANPAIGIDYLSIVEPRTLAPVIVPRGRVMLTGAIRLGDVRLIDNVLVDLPGR